MNTDSELALILAPIANDAAVAVDVLRQAGIAAVECVDADDLSRRINEGCAAIVIADEALQDDRVSKIQAALRVQPAWSDIPIILLSSKTSVTHETQLFSASGNISTLERPFSRVTLVSAVETAIRARRKQYHSRQVINDQIEAAIRRDEFFATLSHELRTPLNVILGWIEILISGDLDRKSQLEALKILDRNARVQKSLIDDLLDTSRIITGKLYFELAPVSLVAMLTSIHQEFVPRATEKEISFELVVPESDCVTYADPSRLSQVFTNLITNAIKFTQRRGTITMTLVKKGTEYEVSVRDTGQGMDPAFLPYVFDRLKQEDMSTTRSHGGLGLGLAITAHIVEQHQGTIRALSEGRGKGSEFVVTLPVYLQTAPRISQLPTPSKQMASLEGTKILVVDDSADIRQLIELWLKKAKATVKLAGSGREGLAEFPSFKPDILLSDIGMPEMDGYQFIEKIRHQSDEKLRAVPAVALTAYAKDEERARAIDAGFQLHISKPISNERLIEAVATLLSTKSP